MTDDFDEDSAGVRDHPYRNPKGGTLLKRIRKKAGLSKQDMADQLFFDGKLEKGTGNIDVVRMMEEGAIGINSNHLHVIQDICKPGPKKYQQLVYAYFPALNPKKLKKLAGGDKTKYAGLMLEAGRMREGLSQQDLAEHAKINADPHTVDLWEMGKRPIPFHKCAALTEILKFTDKETRHFTALVKKSEQHASSLPEPFSGKEIAVLPGGDGVASATEHSSAVQAPDYVKLCKKFPACSVFGREKGQRPAGQLLAAYRQMCGLSQEELGSKLHYKREIRDWENGTPIPTHGKEGFMHLAKFFSNKIPPSYKHWFDAEEFRDACKRPRIALHSTESVEVGGASATASKEIKLRLENSSEKGKVL